MMHGEIGTLDAEGRNIGASVRIYLYDAAKAQIVRHYPPLRSTTPKTRSSLALIWIDPRSLCADLDVRPGEEIDSLKLGGIAQTEISEVSRDRKYRTTSTSSGMRTFSRNWRIPAKVLLDPTCQLIPVPDSH